MPRLFSRILLLALLLMVCAAGPPAPAPGIGQEQQNTPTRPPLTPRWVFEPWAWEDNDNTANALRELVNGYFEHGIPLGTVIIDSPWQTNYNTFEFGPNYPDPAGLIGELHTRGVKVLLWSTSFVNVRSEDGPDRGKAANYDEALAAGFFVEAGRTFEWYKGWGSAIDFFNPEAVAWWYRRLDRAFDFGVDGWKVDAAENNLPDEIETAVGRRSLREYRDAYYRAMYRYVADRNPEAIIAARPYAYESTDALGPGGGRARRGGELAPPPVDAGIMYAPVDANPAGWVGDQVPDWPGLEEALDNILASAERGYSVLGSDIGGYHPGRRSARLFIRWTQLGALSPLMENGGRGEHRPWKLGSEALGAYRYYAKLHYQLVPYLYSAGVEAHLTGRPIIRQVDRQARQYTLGEDLLVAPIVSRDDERDVLLPPGSRWHDYWDDDRVLEGPRVSRHQGPTERVPLYIRGGAIISMDVADAETGHGDAGSSGRLTLLLYPDGETARLYYPDPGRPVVLKSIRADRRVTVEISPNNERYVLRIKESAAPAAVMLERGDSASLLQAMSDWSEFDAAAHEGWYYDSTRHHLWVRFATEGTAARLTAQLSEPRP
jgi:alpha-glucosidase (family GH31 glycosyl hydrolase)